MESLIHHSLVSFCLLLQDQHKAGEPLCWNDQRLSPTITLRGSNRPYRITLGLSHPCHYLFTWLSNGTWWKSIWTRTSCHQDSFFPEALYVTFRLFQVRVNQDEGTCMVSETVYMQVWISILLYITCNYSQQESCGCFWMTAHVDL